MWAGTTSRSTQRCKPRGWHLRSTGFICSAIVCLDCLLCSASCRSSISCCKKYKELNPPCSRSLQKRITLFIHMGVKGTSLMRVTVSAVQTAILTGTPSALSVFQTLQGYEIVLTLKSYIQRLGKTGKHIQYRKATKYQQPFMTDILHGSTVIFGAQSKPWFLPICSFCVLKFRQVRLSIFFIAHLKTVTSVPDCYCWLRF